MSSPHANHQGEPGDTGTGDEVERLAEIMWRAASRSGESIVVSQRALHVMARAVIASAPTLPDRVGEVEKLATAIDAADHGYSIKLKSLTEAGSVYTLDLCDGSDLIEFSDREDARDHAERHRSLARAKAALAFLSARNWEAQ